MVIKLVLFEQLDPVFQDFSISKTRNTIRSLETNVASQKYTELVAEERPVTFWIYSQINSKNWNNNLGRVRNG